MSHATLFNYVSKGKKLEPDFARTIGPLSTEEIRGEIELGRGGADYQAALKAELERRPR